MENLIASLINGLLYPSESEEPVAYFTTEGPNNDPLNPGDVAELLGLPERTVVAACDPSLFWEIVTVWHPWYGPQERERTRRFNELKEWLESELSFIQYFEAGKTETTLLLVGIKEDHLCGIKTMAVRT